MDRLISGLRPYILLSLVCLVVYLPGLSTVPPIDRDEARFVQASRQMLETGDFIDIRFQEEARHRKPVGIYWLQAASVAAFSDPQAQSIWAWRLVSVFGATGAVLATFHLGALLFGRRAAFVGALALAVSLVMAVEAHIAKTDAMLVFLTVVAQAALARTYLSGRVGPETQPADAAQAAPLEEAAPPEEPPPPEEEAADPSAQAARPRRPGHAVTAAVFWVAVGMSVLIKGPIAPMVVGLTALTLSVVEWRWRWLLGLRLAWGPPLALAIAAPWIVAIEIISGGAFLLASIGDDLFAKVAITESFWDLPPGVHLALISLVLWPASLVLWPALIGAARRWRAPEIRFCAAWIIPTWLVFELVPTKLVHYTLPVVPALALVIGAAIAGSSGPWPALRHWLAKVWYVIWGVIGLCIGGALVYAAVVYAPGFEVLTLLMGIAAGAAAIGGTFLALWGLQRGDLGRPMAAAMAGGALSVMLTFGLLIPQLDRLWVSRSLSDAVSAFEPAGPVALTGFREPSAVFLLGTDTVLDIPSRVAAHLRSTPGTLVGVEDRQLPAFLRSMREYDIPYEPAGQIEGFNYARGWPVSISLYRNTADARAGESEGAGAAPETGNGEPPVP